MTALALGLAAAMLAAAGPQSSHVRTVSSVDLDRYAGEWFEIARLPNRFQTKCAGDVRARYSRRPDGRIDVVNSCRAASGDTTTAHGVARVTDPATRARLKVRFAPAALSFLPFVWGDYWIIGLADDYAWAVVGSPDRKYLWLLSRSSSMREADREAALRIAGDNGFEIARLQWTAR